MVVGGRRQWACSSPYRSGRVASHDARIAKDELDIVPPLTGKKIYIYINRHCPTPNRKRRYI